MVPPPERLESWKGIAAYLKRGVRTVQRWEKPPRFIGDYSEREGEQANGALLSEVESKSDHDDAVPARPHNPAEGG